MVTTQLKKKNNKNFTDKSTSDIEGLEQQWYGCQDI